jgi:class 3 adenylate cyclase
MCCARRSAETCSCASATQLRLRTAAHEAATSSALLRRMLPEGVISRLLTGQQMIAESMESITVLFSDVVSFTSLASQVPTTELDSSMLPTKLSSRFDALCDKYGCYKVETIGDAVHGGVRQRQCAQPRRAHALSPGRDARGVALHPPAARQRAHPGGLRAPGAAHARVAGRRRT